MKKTFVLLGLIAVSLFSQAQNPISTVQILPTYPTADSTQLADMDSEIRGLLAVDLELEIDLSSTSNISKIAAKVGLAEGGSDLFYKEFEYNTVGSFEDGTSYSSDGTTVTLGLGQLEGYGTYHTEVFVIRGDGTKESPTRNILD